MKVRGREKLIMGAAGGAALFLLVAVFWMTPGRVAPGVKVDGVDLGGLDQARAMAVLQSGRPLLPAGAIRLLIDGRSIRLSPTELGLTPDPAGSVSAALAVGRRGGPVERLRERWTARHKGVDLSLEYSLDPVRLAALVSDLSRVVRRPPEDARIEFREDEPVVIRDLPGRELDGGELARRLKSAASAAQTAVVIPTRSVLAALTAAKVEAMGVKKLLGQVTTRFDPSLVGRTQNIRLAAQSIDWALIRPGDVLSFNQLLGPITRENGYQTAIEIRDGEFVPGVGGGVCQVASTLYSAALMANLQVLERVNHSLAVTYIPLGMDATVGEGLDLKIKNSAASYIMVRAELSADKLSIKIFGDGPEGQAVVLRSVTLAEYPYPEEIVEEPGLPAGETRIKSPGTKGFMARAYRDVYRWEKLVRSELLSTDYYAPAKRVVQKGIGPPR